MKNVFVDAYNIISPLGNTAVDNYNKVKSGITGVCVNSSVEINDDPLWASLIDSQTFNSATNGIQDHSFTRYEKLIIASISDALKNSAVDLTDKETIFIFSTTKGNITLLENEKSDDEVNLYLSARKITEYFNNKNKAVVISNACISGVVALIYARRILNEGYYKNAIVTGADCINRFIYSGFLSFQALSQNHCRPFSESRDGINLGEAASTIILTTSDQNHILHSIQLLNGAVTNDSNHISGPSRTGEELHFAIEKAIKLSDINKSDIGFISAHGTATQYNDEMEAKAINLSNLNEVPVNSLKGYFGHTLGAAGLVESVISIMALEKDELIPTFGFYAPVVKPEVNVSSEAGKKPGMKHFLKTASGFGGCNAAIIFSKS